MQIIIMMMMLNTLVSEGACQRHLPFCARFIADSTTGKVMTASLRSCCVGVSNHPVQRHTILPFALHIKHLRQYRRSLWVSTAQTQRVHRSYKPRAVQANAFVSAHFGSAGSGVSVLFAVSTLYCIPFYALVSTIKACNLQRI